MAPSREHGDATTEGMEGSISTTGGTAWQVSAGICRNEENQAVQQRFHHVFHGGPTSWFHTHHLMFRSMREILLKTIEHQLPLS